MHYWTNHAIIVLIGLHFVWTLLVGAFRKPYEVLWITGLLLPAARSAPRVIGFITAFAWCEVVGVLTAASPSLRTRPSQSFCTCAGSGKSLFLWVVTLKQSRLLYSQ